MQRKQNAVAKKNAQVRRFIGITNPFGGLFFIILQTLSNVKLFLQNTVYTGIFL